MGDSVPSKSYGVEFCKRLSSLSRCPATLLTMGAVLGAGPGVKRMGKNTQGFFYIVIKANKMNIRARKVICDTQKEP